MGRLAQEVKLLSSNNMSLTRPRGIIRQPGLGEPDEDAGSNI